MVYCGCGRKFVNEQAKFCRYCVDPFPSNEDEPLLLTNDNDRKQPAKSDFDDFDLDLSAVDAVQSVSLGKDGALWAAAAKE